MSYRRENSTAEKPFCTAAKRRGWAALKFVVPSVRGYPDRLLLKGLDEAVRYCRQNRDCDSLMGRPNADELVRGIIERVIEFVELKSPDATRDEAHLARQARRHAELRTLGFKVTQLESREEVDQFYEDRA